MAVGNSLPPPTHSQNLIGHRIDDGKLEFVSVLGLGAYGVVYLARDVSPPNSEGVTGAPENPPGSYYAVKCLNKVGMDGRQRSFQRREIALHGLASSHANVATLHNVIETPTCIYVILAYYNDGDLFGMITERGRYLAQDELIRSVFLQIIDAVDYCHRLGIYHRDLKPENILCYNHGKSVVLADFGLATAEKTSADFGCGSTFYMSPECQGGLFQRLGSYSTLQNDVWSLGVILVNLTCGRNPWKQACPTDETFRAYLQNSDFLRAILPISASCNNLLKRIFSLNPAQRITLSELRSEVECIKRWTMTEAELKCATRATREAARAFAPAPPSPKTASLEGSPIVSVNSWGEAAVPATFEEVSRFQAERGFAAENNISVCTSQSSESSWADLDRPVAHDSVPNWPISPVTPHRTSVSAPAPRPQQQHMPPTPPQTPRRHHPSLQSAAPSRPRVVSAKSDGDVSTIRASMDSQTVFDAMVLDTPPSQRVELPALLQTPPTPPTPSTPRMGAPRQQLKRRIAPLSSPPVPGFDASGSSSSSGSSTSSSAWSAMPQTPERVSFPNGPLGGPIVDVVVVSPTPSGAPVVATASFASESSMASEVSSKAPYSAYYPGYAGWAASHTADAYSMSVDAPASPPLTAPSSPVGHMGAFAYAFAAQMPQEPTHHTLRPREQVVRVG